MAKINISDVDKKKYVDAMGEELAEIYSALYGEIVGLHLEWAEYMELFGLPNRVALLNEAAGGFFHMVQGLLSDAVMLGIARVTDSPASRGKPNLVISRLPGLVREEHRQSILLKVEEADNAAGFCRDWRNRSLAHRDLGLFLQREAVKPLESATVDKIENALAKLAGVIQFVAHEYLDTHIALGHIIRQRRAESLLYVLDDGLKRKEERKKKLQDGIFENEDRSRVSKNKEASE